jgi:hypothetical protein
MMNRLDQAMKQAPSFLSGADDETDGMMISTRMESMSAERAAGQISGWLRQFRRDLPHFGEPDVPLLITWVFNQARSEQWENGRCEDSRRSPKLASGMLRRHGRFTKELEAPTWTEELFSRFALRDRGPRQESRA